MKFLEELAARRRFGMKPGLETIRAVCAALGDPQKRFKAVHIAGTNGKGAVSAVLDAVFGDTARYTSPHLVRLNERFTIGGSPVDDETLDRVAERIAAACGDAEVTFFEALTAVAYELFAEKGVRRAILECGLGGRLDATNVCEPELSVITKIGLDHCDWLGDTVEKIAAEKAGIIKPGVPVLLARNAPSVRAVVEARAKEVGAPFHYAPELADEGEIPDGFPLKGAFNRENAVTAMAALRVLGEDDSRLLDPSFRVVWPGRYQRIGRFLVDGAHNPPAADALAASLKADGLGGLELVCGFCGDKDALKVLKTLSPFVKRGFAVRTNNPRSLSAESTASLMREAGIPSEPMASLSAALDATGSSTLVCGSLFLAGEALVALDAYPWGASRFDASELLRPSAR